MRTSGVARHYDALTPDERLGAVLRAVARGDNAEARRLGAACPKKQYAMSDAAYADRLDLSLELTLVLLVDLAGRLGKLHMVGVTRSLLDAAGDRAADLALGAYERGFADGARADRNAAGRPPRVPELGLREAEGAARRLEATFAGIVDGLEAALAAHARGPLDGFGRFARRAWGVGPEVPLAAWAGRVLELLEQHRPALDGAEPDAQEVAQLAEALTTVWRARLGLGDDGNP